MNMKSNWDEAMLDSDNIQVKCWLPVFQAILFVNVEDF